MNVLIVTACGAEKNREPMIAVELYKSPRIKALYNRRGSSDMHILSAEYGLVDARETIKPYERVMDEQRAKELTGSVAAKLQKYDWVVFFKGGCRKAYLSCIENACKLSGKGLVVFGYANMGGLRNLGLIIRSLKNGKLTDLSGIEQVKVLDFINQTSTDG